MRELLGLCRLRRDVAAASLVGSPVRVRQRALAKPLETAALVLRGADAAHAEIVRARNGSGHALNLNANAA
jgi:hypothetical protein